MSLEEDPALSHTPQAKGTGSHWHMTRVAWVSVGAASVVMVALIFAGYRQLDALRRDIESKQAQLNDLQSRYDALDTSYGELETSFKQLKYIMSVLPRQPEQGKGAIPGVSATGGPATLASAEPMRAPSVSAAGRPASLASAGPMTAPRVSNAPSKSTARIGIYIGNDGQRREAEVVGDRLRAAGYVVTETRVVPVTPEQTQLRYFQQSDEKRPDLAGITKTLQQAKIEADPKYVPPDAGSVVAPGKFELWLGAAK